MITGSTTIVHSSDWQREMADGFRNPRQLLDALSIEPAAIPDLDTEASDFPQRVPRAFVTRMKPGDHHDPLLRQVLPLRCERHSVAGYSHDPLQEISASKVPGVVHKYHGRVLLITTGACAIHCRYCFRRHFPYQEHSRSGHQWQTSLDYIREQTSISEVILSGGDPLALNDQRLQYLLEALDAIPHLKRLRIHTRLPIVLPNRITSTLIQILRSSRLRRSLVVHCNHPNELDQAVADKLESLSDSGTSLFNQAVLLKQVNDTLDSQVRLSERLFDLGVIPYYLHLLDPVAGSAHFDISDLQARQLYRQMLEHLPGYLVPKLVRETANERYKNPVSAG